MIGRVVEAAALLVVAFSRRQPDAHDGAGVEGRSSSQRNFENLALAASMVFLLLVIGPAFIFAHDEVMITTPAMFTGGLLPGLVLGLTQCMLAWRRYRGEDLGAVKRPAGRTILKSLAIAFPALLLPFVIRAAVVEGVATSIEVSTIGIVYAILVGLLIYGSFRSRGSTRFW